MYSYIFIAVNLLKNNTYTIAGARTHQLSDIATSESVTFALSGE